MAEKITTCLRCRKCDWCNRRDNYDANKNPKRWWTYSCSLTVDNPAAKGKAPTLDDHCPHFREPSIPIDVVDELP